ncbi:alanyl-tRNA synthetase [Kineothrix alysoides]|uniref:Alanyl-tRNA synthetase n=1 Tax=Kineothrix alysoides TaxID=1469948 RepID=A0A4R1QX31_9FIRM|nr:serine-tRNA(Ala) deacylase AlaX [Kineothrix alysoides]TCL55954.1 alanyl-tRNA synthetase [Kineothrix alysoides]
MEKTQKLYDIDAYTTDFTAAVISCCPVTPSKEGEEVSSPLYEIILDQTLFFPEEGGQSSDTGTLNEVPVSHVKIENGIITHITNAPISIGETVTGQIHWESRYSNMQQHSGEHIMSGLIHSHFGYDNVGFHLGSQAVTLDFNGFLEEEQLREIENLANEAIYRNIEVLAEYPPAQVLEDLNYRSKIELNEAVRIVTIPGYDICACCAPHVKRTGEIGIIKIVDAIRHRGGIRISILCGNRALEDFKQKQEQVYAVSALLSAKPELIAPAVERLKEENFSLRGEILGLQESLIQLKVSQIAEGTKNCCLFEESMDSPAHRKYVNMLAEKCSGICGVFVGNDENGYRYIIASKYEDVRTVNEKLKQSLDAKGGGSKEMVQGSLLGFQEAILALF